MEHSWRPVWIPIGYLPLSEPACNWLILLTQPPYFDQRTIAGIDTVLATGAFGQSVTVALIGAAREQLRPGQSAPEAFRSIYRQILSLPLYDIDELLLVDDVDQAAIPALTSAEITELGDLRIRVISPRALGEKIHAAHHVLSF